MELTYSNPTKVSLPRKCGFTIIELMVVIGILALLAGLIFPVFQSSRRSGRITATAENLRQMNLGLILYMDQNGLTLPGDLLPQSDDIYPNTGHILKAPNSQNNILGLPLASFLSPCGELDARAVKGMSVSYIRNHELWDWRMRQWQQLYQSNLVTFLDMNCNDASVNLYNQYEPKFGVGVLFAGNIVRKRADGIWYEPSFWSDPIKP